MYCFDLTQCGESEKILDRKSLLEPILKSDNVSPLDNSFYYVLTHYESGFEYKIRIEVPLPDRKKLLPDYPEINIRS